MNQTHFTQRYDQTVAQLTAAGLVEAGELPSLEEMMGTITLATTEEEQSFESFEHFFNWWDVLMAYEQLDEETNVEAHKPALAIAYEALQAQGSI
jgi:hypothetical protein